MNHVFRNFFLLAILSCCLFTAYGQKTTWGVYNMGYTYENDRFMTSARLPGGEVSGLGYDSKGTLYLGIRGYGVHGLAKDANQYFQLKAPRDIKTYHRNVTDLLVDKQDRIWVGTTKGLAMLDGDTWTSYERDDASGFPFKSISELFIAADGKLYAVGFLSNLGIKGVPLEGGGLAVLEGNRWRVFNTDNSDIPFNFVAHLTDDGKGGLWMTAGREDEGLLHYDGNTFELFTKGKSDLPSAMIRDLGVLPNGDLVIGTVKGVFVKRESTWERVDITQPTLSKSLDKLSAKFQPDVRSLAVDADGYIWAGIFNEGVVKIKGGSTQFMQMANSPITSNDISRIDIQEDGKIWFYTGVRSENLTDAFFGNETGGFNGVFSMQRQDYQPVDGWEIFHTENSLIGTNRFTEMVAGEGGQLWGVNGGNNIYHFDGKNWQTFPSNMKGLMAGFNRVTVGTDGAVYAGTQTKGMHVYKDGSFTVYDKKNSDVGDQVLHLAAGPSGEVWFATYKGLSRMKDGKVEVFDKKSAGLPTNIIQDISIGSDGSLWFASQKGIGRYHENEWQFWDKKTSGLAGNFVEHITALNTGTAWAITRRGLARFDGTDWSMVDNVLGVEYGFSTLTSGNEKVYLGTTERGLYVWENNNWTQYSYGNSAIYLPRIHSLAVAPDGDVWVSNSIIVQTLAPGQTAPQTGASPEDLLREKIRKFNPVGIVLKMKK